MNPYKTAIVETFYRFFYSFPVFLCLGLEVAHGTWEAGYREEHKENFKPWGMNRFLQPCVLQLGEKGRVPLIQALKQLL